MKIIDYIILAFIAAAFITALIWIIKRKKSGKCVSCSCCDNCSADCCKNNVIKKNGGRT